jgi:trehalose/maltose transport system permease protein
MRGVVRLVNQLCFYLLVGAILFYLLFPFYWTIVTSFKPQSELTVTPVSYWPSSIDFSHYQTIFAQELFLTALRNSILIAGTTIPLSLFFGAMAAYALGRLRFRGSHLLRYSVLVMLAFPHISIITGLFLFMVNPCVLVGGNCEEWQLFNTPWALVLTYLAFNLPLTVWLLAGYFHELPVALEHAAYVDGASPLQTFYLVMLPLVLPGLVVTSLLSFIAVWNEFLFALVLTADPTHRTVPVAMAFFTMGSTETQGIAYGEITAAAVIVTLPIVVVTLLFEHRIVSGMVAGSVKG